MPRRRQGKEKSAAPNCPLYCHSAGGKMHASTDTSLHMITFFMGFKSIVPWEENPS
jgi:hypothetical protein